MAYMVGGFRSTVPESAGWHSHIAEPQPEECQRCGEYVDEPGLCGDCQKEEEK